MKEDRVGEPGTEAGRALLNGELLGLYRALSILAGKDDGQHKWPDGSEDRKVYVERIAAIEAEARSAAEERVRRGARVVARLPRMLTEADDYSWVPLGDVLVALMDTEQAEQAWPEGTHGPHLTTLRDAALAATPAERAVSDDEYAGLIKVAERAKASGAPLHIATRSTCAEHIAHGDDKASVALAEPAVLLYDDEEAVERLQAALKRAGWDLVPADDVIAALRGSATEAER